MMTCTENGQRPAVEFNSVLNAAVGCEAPYSMLYRGARPQINLGIGVRGPYSASYQGALPLLNRCMGGVAPIQGCTGAHSSLSTWYQGVLSPLDVVHGPGSRLVLRCVGPLFSVVSGRGVHAKNEKA